MFFPTRDDYARLAGEYRLVPVARELGADTETPVTLYARFREREFSFLLESVEGGEKLARYSFLGVEPLAVYRHKGRVGEFVAPPGAFRENLAVALAQGGLLLQEGPNGSLVVEGSPVEILKWVMRFFGAPALPGLPRFYGGAVGYLGYDLVRWLERLPAVAEDDLGLPEVFLVFTGTLLILDHLKHTLQVVVNTLPGAGRGREYEEAVGRIEEVCRLLGEGVPPGAGRPGPQPEPARSGCPALTRSNMSAAEFVSRVRKAKEYIRNGDILQVVLSQRLEVPFEGDAFAAYRLLRRLNPSPYLYYLQLGDLVIAGSSPEMLLRVEGGEAETRPIAGTRPRGKDALRDELLAKELLADPKEKAEHVMLVDLGRNDLGRVCQLGTVTVPQFMAVERYSHVMHLVSSVRGKLAPGKTSLDALWACFPAGTVSGAPKVRAMEIIEELEPQRRGPYAGAVGYLGYNGNLDMAITIRTFIFHRRRAYVQAGAGIVADSDPEREYQETVNKAMALLCVLESLKSG